MKLFFPLLLVFATPFIVCAQFTSIRDIDLTAKYISQKTEDNQYFLVYKVAKENQDKSSFHKVAFDNTLTPVDTTEISLSENFQILAMAKSAQYEVYAFGSLQTGKIRFIWVDVLTRKHHQTILSRTSEWTAKNNVVLQSTQTPDVFCVVHELDNRNTEIQLIRPTGKTQTIKKLYTGKRLEVKGIHQAADKLLFNIATETQNDKKVKYHVLTVNTVTGKEMYTKEISNIGNMFAVDKMKVIEGSLHIVGRKYNAKTIDHHTSGQPTMMLVDINSGKLDEIKLTGTPALCYWEDVFKSDAGSYFLVGEKFSKGNTLEYIAKTATTKIFTLGFLTAEWNALTLNDVVVLEIKNGQQQIPVVVSLFPQTVQAKFNRGPYSLAAYTSRSDQDRYFGKNQSHLFLRNGDVMMAQGLNGKSGKDIAMVREDGSPMFVYVLNESAVVVREHKADKKLDLELIKFPKLP